MDLNQLLEQVKDCPCGRVHTFDLEAVEIKSGLVRHVGRTLSKYKFPKKILLVADHNTMQATEPLIPSLHRYDFQITMQIYPDLREASMDEVCHIEELSKSVDGILSVGSGSLNDICRLAAFRQNKQFAIFATAPSMDGFASDSAPITDHNFKVSYPARQPRIILADTKVLADAPVILKSAGFGDIIAKSIGLADWRISALVTGEYYCERVANVTRTALQKIISLADKIQANDEEAAGAVMEALILTGVAMQMVHNSRPASGTEHIISHYWEIKKLERGQLSDYHGRKVGVATILANKIYQEAASHETITAHADNTDWDRVYKLYGANFEADVRKMNEPTTITDDTTPETVQNAWPQIRKIIQEELLSDEALLDVMQRAGAPTTVKEIAVSPQLCKDGLFAHPYMRRRMTLMRLLPMITLE